MTNRYQTFQRYWREWEGKLKGPITQMSSQLRFPEYLEEIGASNGGVELKPPFPVCIFNAPQKGASNKRGISHKQTIFIDGSFQLNVAQESPFLEHGKASVSFFDTMQATDGSFSLKEVDAVHFDMELRGASVPYHPTFHAQRDTSNRLTDEMIREALEKGRRIDPRKVNVERNSQLGTQHLRLPTPQMDLFAVFTMVIADFFCTGGDKDTTRFEAILEHLTHAGNAAREGVVAKALNERARGAYTCPAHWYPEYGRVKPVA
jgi:hypothetical protein